MCMCLCVRVWLGSSVKVSSSQARQGGQPAPEHRPVSPLYPSSFLCLVHSPLVHLGPCISPIPFSGTLRLMGLSFTFISISFHCA
ncbi:unnamed protein product [Lota lota]